MSETTYAEYASRMSSYENRLCTSTNEMNFVRHKRAEVDEELSFFPSGDEASGIGLMFSERKSLRGPDEEICCINSFETDRYLVLDDFPFSDEFCTLNNDSEICTTVAVQNRNQALDGMAEQCDERSVNAELNTLSACAEHLSEKVFHEDYKFLLVNTSPDKTSNANNMIVLSERKCKDEGGELTRKRTRKPTKRYIEEMSDVECGLWTKRSGFQDKIFHDLRDDDDDVPNHLLRRSRPKKNLPQHVGEQCQEGKPGHRPWMSSDSEHEGGRLDAVQESGRKCGTRRKHHRLWSLAEVMKLVDGVSRYGVGRWTKIKRFLFSSSGHRTSVDLKDKWRNLLRASGVQMHGKKKELEAKRKMQSGMVPASVLRRVRDLAVIHPYPRDRPFRERDSPALSWTSS